MIQHQRFQIFIESPTSSITHALMATIESLGTLKGVMLNNSYHRLWSEISTIRSLYHYDALKGNDRSCIDILLTLNDEKSDNDIYRYFHIYKKCYEFAANIKSEYGVILPTDFLRIDSAIKQCDTTIFEDEAFIRNNEYQIKQISQPLTTLYSNSIHRLLNIAVVCCMLSDCNSEYDIEVGALEVLFRVMVNHSEKHLIIPIQLSKWLLLSGAGFSSSDESNDESRVIDLLSYLNNEFEYMSLQAAKISKSIELLNNHLVVTIPKLCSQGLISLLSSTLCFQYGDFTKELSVTYKTAVERLKQLEAKGFVTSARVGREKVFINNYMFSLVQEEESYGS